jgi:hypothetical protein
MKKLILDITTLILIFTISSFAYANDKGNTKFQLFNKAKKILRRQVYHDHHATFYCQCPFTKDKKSSTQMGMSQRKSGSELTGWNGNISWPLSPTTYLLIFYFQIP